MASSTEEMRRLPVRRAAEVLVNLSVPRYADILHKNSRVQGRFCAEHNPG